MDDAHRAIEAVARDSYGRLVSYLAARWRDVAAVEDALADAFVAALATWPRTGVPDKPEAWLLATSRHRLIDRARHLRMRDGALVELGRTIEEAEHMSSAHPFPDERLALLFVCAHPAIDPAIHTPLMLQVVLGLDAAAIARAFLLAPATMGQRLSRAKTKIRDAGIAFEVPAGVDLSVRLEAVLQAIYAAYGSGWDDVTGVDPRTRGLTREAIWLVRVLRQLLPDEPEVDGLLALMLYCEARRRARRSADGRYVPMSEQVTSLWSAARLDEANRLLAAAATKARAGRFQLEAAIQAAHIDRLSGRPAGWRAIALLYEGLVRVAPTLGALIGRAAAVAEAQNAAAGLALLDRLAPDDVQDYQPYWAVRGHLLQGLGQHADARAALARAMKLTADPAIRAFLSGRRDPP